MARKNLRNLLQRHEVIERGAGNSYNPPVNNDEIWKAVGRTLKARREFEGYDSTSALRRKIPTAPDVRMMTEIENGTPRTVTLLAKYCDVLGVSLHVVLADVLNPCDVSEMALVVARAYDEMPAEAQTVALPLLKVLRDKPPGDTPRSAPSGAASPTLTPRAPKQQARRR